MINFALKNLILQGVDDQNNQFFSITDISVIVAFSYSQISSLGAWNGGCPASHESSLDALPFA